MNMPRPPSSWRGAALAIAVITALATAAWPVVAAQRPAHTIGSDIMIHGNQVSIGCLAVGDQAAEDLFVLAADTGLARIAVILAPHDLRRAPPPAGLPALPRWAPSLYASIAAALHRLPPD